MSAMHIYNSTNLQYCEYNCGQLATYYRFKSGKLPNGKYMCASHPNSCPAKRAKTTGDKNPSKRDDVRKSISEKNKIIFANDGWGRKKCQETLFKRYGVTNPSSNPEIRAKAAQTRLAEGTYAGWDPSVCHSPEAKAKRTQTRIARGLQMDPSLLDAFHVFEVAVDRITEKNYKKFKSTINPNKAVRSQYRGGYQLDHILSKVDGFNLGLDPEIVSHPANLRMLTVSENISKSSRSDMTAVELLREIRLTNYPIRKLSGSEPST
jgi:hypothetical protein